MPVLLRDAAAGDAPFLAEVLVLAATWRAGGPPRQVADVLADPALARYVAGWPRPGDLGVVALDGPDPVGAAWLRLLPADERGYGFVDADTPELTVGVVPAWRGCGVGTQLVGALADRASRRGLAAVSLSVEADNPARRLYDRLGFAPVARSGGAVTMLLQR